jgi:capsular polysaccharide biosynthesis protein
MQEVSFVSLDAASDDESQPVTRILRIDPEHSVPPAMAFSYGPGQDLIDGDYAANNIVWPISVYAATGIEIIGPWFNIGIFPMMGDTCLVSQELYQSKDCSSSGDALKKIEQLRTSVSAGAALRRRVPGQCALIATQGHLVYGHWLVDFLPKLYLLRKAGFDVDELSFLIPLNMDPSSFTAPNVLKLLRIVGLREDQLVTYDPNIETLCPDELIIPTSMRMNGRLSFEFADSIAYLNDRIRIANPMLGTGLQSRVFISRAKARLEVEQKAADSRFAIVYPEQISMLEQISLFRGAREIIGQYGSALHGSIYSSAGTKVCGLQGTGGAASGFVQSGIGERLDQPTGYVFGLEQKLHPVFRFFHIASADLAECISKEFV